MKNNYVILFAMVASGLAQAQSSVTIYGVMDEGLVYTNNQGGHSNTQLVTGQTNGSRFGFSGVEDLGGDLKAVFVLENGFNMATGTMAQHGRLFGRQAFVGLQSSQFGTITLGRQYDPTFEYIGTSSAAILWGWLGTHPGDFDNLFATIRVDNSIKYMSPAYEGLKFEGLFAPGGVAGSFEQNRIYSVGMHYENGPFSLAASFLNVHNPAISAYDGTTDSGDPKFVSPTTSPQYSGYSSAQALRVIGAAGTYTVGPAKFGIVYTNTRFENVSPFGPTPFTGGTAVFQSLEGNLKYQLTPFMYTGISYDYTMAETAHYGQLNIGADYFLSKRTDLNLVGVWQHAAGKDSTGKSAVAGISSLAASSTPNQIAVKLSLRHSF
jgi:predicted porin